MGLGQTMAGRLKRRVRGILTIHSSRIIKKKSFNQRITLNSHICKKLPSK